MAHIVTCVYCKGKFDRDKEQYSLVSSRRYAHAACMLREAEKDPKYEKKEIIDPTDNVICVYCKKPLSKKDSNCVMVLNGKYAHAECENIEQNREKTDQELLDEYIKKLFNIEYVDLRIKAQIKQYINDYNFSYSGIRKALIYFYEVKGNSIEKSRGGIGIVPYIYKDAYNYYFALWQAQQKNEDKVVQQYVPAVKEIVIPRPQRKVKTRPLFSFLDEEMEAGNEQ